ncbi:hypothetical protein D9M71_846840 [compost metagenome]
MKAVGFIFRSEHAPGGVPMMVVNDKAGGLIPRGALRFIASVLAPTGGLAIATKTKPLPAYADRGFGI